MRFFHPITKTTAVCCVLPVIMFCTSLTAAVWGLLAGLLGLVFTRGGKTAAKAAGFTLGAAAVTALTNPLFSHRGATVLLFVNGRAYTLEAMIYGGFLAISASAAICLIMTLTAGSGREELTSLLARVFPKAAMAVSLSLGAVPAIIRKTASVKSSREMAGVPVGESFLERVRFHGESFMTAASWAAESAAGCSQSMNARGYGRAAPSHTMRPMKLRDKLVTITYALLLAAAVTAYSKGGSQWFYPRIMWGELPWSAVFAAVFALMSAGVPLMYGYAKRIHRGKKSTRGAYLTSEKL